jgi:hypothetical protein
LYPPHRSVQEHRKHEHEECQRLRHACPRGFRLPPRTRTGESEQSPARCGNSSMWRAKDSQGDKGQSPNSILSSRGPMGTCRVMVASDPRPLVSTLGSGYLRPGSGCLPHLTQHLPHPHPPLGSPLGCQMLLPTAPIADEYWPQSGTVPRTHGMELKE